MGLLPFFSVLFFSAVLVNLLPYDWALYVSPLVGGIAYFVAFGGFIFSFVFIVPLLFEEKLVQMKTYIYVAVAAFTACLTVSLILRTEIYMWFGGTALQYVVLAVTSAVVLFCLLRIHSFVKVQGIQINEVNWQFLKMGAQFEETLMFKAVTRLDRYFIAFAVLSVILESIVLLVLVTILLLVLATKDVRIVWQEFRQHFTGSLKPLWTVAIFYGSYFGALFVEFLFAKDALTILVASLSLLFIKIYYHEIVKETLQSDG